MQGEIINKIVMKSKEIEKIETESEREREQKRVLGGLVKGKTSRKSKCLQVAKIDARPRVVLHGRMSGGKRLNEWHPMRKK